jgi:ATP-dependent helicase HrpB
MPVTRLPPLPIDDVLPQLVAAVRNSPCVVLRAPPGAGKTTRVPPALLDAGLAAAGKILVLQPRRVAVRASAARMSHERGTRLGEEIGYQVRFDSKTGPRTRIEVITEGILLRHLQQSPFLEGIAAIVFDEFHERSLASDLALGMVRQIQESVRPELRIVVMSATLAAEPIARYLGNCPTIESQGRMFAVDIRHTPQLDKRPLPEVVAQGATEVLAQCRGDVLVFLPGVGEIRQAAKLLESLAREQNIELLQLYGDLPAAEQDRVLLPGERRKLILSTNVAETSLTIEGVDGVVDSGFARILRYDERTGLDRLELSPISRASADQRAGRAGRTHDGICLRLWPAAAQQIRPEFEEPEIHRIDLAGAVLQILSWIEPDLATFPWFEPPNSRALERACDLLRLLGTLNGRKITPLGSEIAGLPLHPRLGRLLLAGRDRDCLPEVALAAALLSDRDPFLRPSYSPGADRRPSHASRSDLIDRVHALLEFETRGLASSAVGEINRNAARFVLQSRDQLVRLVARTPAARRASRASDEASEADDAVLRAILAAFPDRVARRREPGSRRGVMVGGRGIKLADQVAVGEEELFVCVDVEAGATEALVRQASAVEREWLPPALVRTEVQVEFDPAQEKVIARKRTFFDSLLLEESNAALPSGEEVSAALAVAAGERFAKVFPADDPSVGGFVQRVRCLNAWMPDLKLPTLDELELQSLLPALCAACRSLADVRRAPWLHAIQSLFSYQQLQTIDREAPERLEVPTGSRLLLDYEVGRAPILAVRIQEIFGLKETPRIAGGRVAVLLHLLAPNQRVAQVTDDLAGFWSNTYSLVRKDLRARYPKHAWPEDPAHAPPQRRPSRKS